MMTTSHLEQEILEQPEAVQRLLDAEKSTIRSALAPLRPHFDYVLIAARGTSDNAARYAKYLLQNRCAIPVMLAAPSVFSIYGQKPDLCRALAVGISQSGQSPDVVSVLAAAREQGRPTLALTNDLASPLAAQADLVLGLHTGPELAVAATKTYTASLAALALLSYGLGGNRADLQSIERLPEMLEATLQATLARSVLIERYRFMNLGLTIGRGYNYATACEIALKVMELNSLAMLSYSSADFLHGPVGILRKDFPVFVVAHSGPMLEPTLQMMRQCRKLGADVTAISDSRKALALADAALEVPAGVPEWLSPLTDVLPGQVLGWKLAELRGLDVDQPKGLSKVTETL